MTGAVVLGESSQWLGREGGPGENSVPGASECRKEGVPGPKLQSLTWRHCGST